MRNWWQTWGIWFAATTAIYALICSQRAWAQSDPQADPQNTPNAEQTPPDETAASPSEPAPSAAELAPTHDAQTEAAQLIEAEASNTQLQVQPTPTQAASAEAKPLIAGERQAARSTDTLKPAPPTLDVSEEQIARMDFALARLAESTQGWRTSCVLSGMLGAAAFVGLGTYMAVTTGDVGRDSWRGAWAAGLLGLGGISLAQVVGCLVDEGPSDVPRYARWTSLRKSEALTAIELARFEEELAMEETFGHQRRVRSAVMWFGMALGGVGAVVIAAASRLESDGRVMAYAIGGTYGVLGILAGILSLTSESLGEQVAREYREGKSSDDIARASTSQLSVRFGGNSIFGTF